MNQTLITLAILFVIMNYIFINLSYCFQKLFVNFLEN